MIRFKFDAKLLRGGGSMLGVLLMAAGFVGFFIEPTPAMQEIRLISFGLALFLLSALSINKLSAGETNE